MRGWSCLLPSLLVYESRYLCFQEPSTLHSHQASFHLRVLKMNIRCMTARERTWMSKGAQSSPSDMTTSILQDSEIHPLWARSLEVQEEEEEEEEEEIEVCVETEGMEACILHLTTPCLAEEETLTRMDEGARQAPAGTRLVHRARPLVVLAVVAGGFFNHTRHAGMRERGIGWMAGVCTIHKV